MAGGGSAIRREIRDGRGDVATGWLKAMCWGSTKSGYARGGVSSAPMDEEKERGMAAVRPTGLTHWSRLQHAHLIAFGIVKYHELTDARDLHRFAQDRPTRVSNLLH